MIKQGLKSILERFPSAALFYRNSRDLLDRNRSTIKTPWGFTLAGHPAMAAGSFELDGENSFVDLEKVRAVVEGNAVFEAHNLVFR